MLVLGQSSFMAYYSVCAILVGYSAVADIPRRWDLSC